MGAPGGRADVWDIVCLHGRKDNVVPAMCHQPAVACVLRCHRVGVGGWAASECVLGCEEVWYF